jgi:hypothetical protein
MMPSAMMGIYFLLVTVVTPGQIKETFFPPGREGYPLLSRCLEDLAFYKARWPETPDTEVYFRCKEIRIKPGWPHNDRD